MRLVFLLISILVLALTLSWWFNQLFNTPSLVSPNGRVEQELNQMQQSVDKYNQQLQQGLR